MKKLFLLFSISMLIALTGYSQTGRTVIGEDTLYLIRAQNLRNANAMIMERDLFQKEIASLYDQKRGLNEMVKAYSKEVVLKDSITANYRRMLDMNNKLIAIAQKNNQQLEKKIKRRNFVIYTTTAGLLICLTKILVK